MNFKNSFSLCALAVFASTAAQASVLDLEYKSTQGMQINMVNDGTLVRDYLTGGMQYTDAAGKSFEAFCVEVSQRHSLTGTTAAYTLGSFSQPQAGLLQGLFSSSYAGLSTNFQKTAFQAAIWEITHEQSGNALDVSVGGFRLTSVIGGTSSDRDALRKQANDFLTLASSYQGKPLYEISKLQSAEFQDLITVTAVPEPGTYAMLLAGLGVVGFVARRRQQR